MNDWTAEIANGYGQQQMEAQAHVNKIKEVFATLTVGTKVLIHISANRRDEWKTVAHTYATSAHIGRVRTTDGKEYWASQIILAQPNQTAEVETLQICVNQRLAELFSAGKRGASNDFDVFDDWERNSFVVVNNTNKSEYRVTLQFRNSEIFSSCECPDFKQRNRVCKHQSAVLQNSLEGEYEQLEVEYAEKHGQIKRFSAYAEYGNFKRQHHTKSQSFDTLSEAKAFVIDQIGSLQGFGYVVADGEQVWNYSSEEEYVY